MFSEVPDCIARGPLGWTRAIVLLIPIRLGAKATARARMGGLQVLSLCKKGTKHCKLSARGAYLTPIWLGTKANSKNPSRVDYSVPGSAILETRTGELDSPI